jgi:hypothetical protein
MNGFSPLAVERVIVDQLSRQPGVKHGFFPDRRE